jgi:hypothetical protein
MSGLASKARALSALGTESATNRCGKQGADVGVLLEKKLASIALGPREISRVRRERERTTRVPMAQALIHRISWDAPLAHAPALHFRHAADEMGE